METETLLKAVRTSIETIDSPRNYDNERGLQGQLLVELSKRIPACLPPDRTLIEQEHQKTLEHHGLTIRPDIIIHQPFDPAHHGSRREGNFAVFELKRRASAKEAAEDFGSLAAMLDVLQYPIGIFINIGSDETHANLVPQQARGRIVIFAARLIDGHVRVTEART
jgi:hypothetical protein